MLDHITTTNITDIRNVICAAAVIVGERLGVKQKEKKEKQDPWWKRRIEGDIKILRKDLSKIESWNKGMLRKERDKSHLERKYGKHEKGFNLVIEQIKQRILAKSTKIKRYTEKVALFEHNRMFTSNQKQFYRNICGDTVETLTPNEGETAEFWSGIWGRPIAHNGNAEWIKTVKIELSDVEKQEPISITKENVVKQVKTLPNWKAPGTDGIQGYWIKHLKSLHDRIGNHLNECMIQASVPE